MAAFNLGLMLQNRGDADGAKTFYRVALASGHRTEAPKAAVNLGLLLERAGDAPGAEAAYREGVAYGEPDAVVLLEELRQGRG